MDYETIVKGRRRNWDALKPDEVRQREKEEERARREAERDKDPNRGMTGFQRWRAHLMEQARIQDRKQFDAAMRQAAIIGGVFVACVVVWLVIEQVLATQARSLFSQRASGYETALGSNQAINNLEDPLGAFTTWRSAWMREDYGQLVRTFSPNYLRRVEPSGDQSALARTYLKMAASGGMQPSIALAQNFGSPEPLRVPRAPWSDGQLAIFRSQPIVLYGEEKLYTAAFSFDAKTGTWRFSDLRESPYFSVKWKTEEDILPLKVGSGATRYDDDGNEME